MQSVRHSVLRTLGLCLIVILFAQINIHIFTNRFLISIAPICLPAFLYLLEDVRILPVAVISGFGIFGSRVLMDLISGTPSSDPGTQYLPETMFYVAYGIGLFLFDRLRNHDRKLVFFILEVMFVDYIANALELFTRLGTSSYSLSNQLGLILVAVVRGLILALILGSLDRYRIMLLNRTHAERYQRLIMLISRLNGEMVWMRKNVDQIEKIMDVSYNLYSALKDGGETAFADDALTVAKDIHEVKKEYMLILRGLSESMESETESDVMKMTELFVILIQSVRDEYAPLGKRPIISISKENELATREPYLFLSVFHNLITNAVEAAGEERCIINITEMQEGEHYIYTVQDNGPGVPEEYREKIFEPRFSTKFDEKTGVVNRGLGLSIVKGIVEDSLHGTIRLRSSHSGAVFEITLPKETMEVIK